MKILFVCTQNVFRSMSAHYILEKYLNENYPNHNYKIDSAGTIAYDFETPYSWTINRLKELKINANNHKNKRITKELLKDYDLIICMTEHHREHILKKFQIKTHLYNEIALKITEDVKDDNEADFDTTLEEFVIETVNYINKTIPKLAENIVKINNNQHK